MKRPFQLLDAQAALGFVVSQTTYIERQVNEIVYPDIQYPQLIPVDTSAPEWIKTVTFYSSDKVGKADWVNGNADDLPLASTERSKFESNVHMAAIGYGYGLEEISQAQMLGLNLTADDAAAARRAYEEFVDRVALAGDSSKGFSGLFAYPGVTAGTAVTGNWAAATADQILADVNTALTVQAQGTLFTAFSDTLLMPYSKFLLIATRKVNEQGLESILTYLQKNNVYTATTGRPLTIRGLNGLDTAGAGGTARMISYRRDPSVLKMHIPMPHRFLPVYQAGPIRWEVPGIFRLGGVDIRRPAEVRYTDGIWRGFIMAKVTNTHRITPIGLPSGAVILPSASVDVPEWDEIKDRKNLAFYVLTGVLVVEGGEGGDEQGGEEAYRQQLFAELKSLGVNAGSNSKTETLVAKLAELKAKAAPNPPPADEAAQKQALIDQLAALGVPAGPDATLEELQKALTDKQAEQQ